MPEPSRFPPMPADTARAMEGVLGAKNLYRVIGDEAETLFRTYVPAQFGDDSPARAVLSFRHVLVTVFQFIESLSDAGAADASRVRGDWKYALHVPLSFPGFNASSLCKFRYTLLTRGESQSVFDEIRQWLQHQPQLLSGAQGRIDADEDICAAVCRISQLEWMFDAICCALTVLATEQSGWLRMAIQPAWYRRYAQDSTKSKLPWDGTDQLSLAQTLIADIKLLLQAVDRDEQCNLVRLREVQQLHWILWAHELAGDQSQRPLRCSSCIRLSFE